MRAYWARRARHQAEQKLTELERRRIRLRRKEGARRRAMIALITAGALLLFVVLPWLIWRGPYVIDADHLDDAELKKGSAALVTGLRTAVVAFTAAIGAGLALFYTARTYRLTRRGQITDRFTKALERLGSPEIYVRIGGILALEQIVQDAPEQAATDAARVLGHFIRHQAPKAAPPPTHPDTPHNAPDTNPLPMEPAADVQAALTALTRTESRPHIDPREKLDLHGLHLAGAQLGQADLTHADLAGATLTKAHLAGATLTKAHLAGATLTEADLAGATLREANLAGATLTEAYLAGATLREAYLVDATLTKARLPWATLTEAYLAGATLREAYLAGATLREAYLAGATLREAYLAGATLTKAYLAGATLTEADLAGATLTEANLSEADLSSAHGMTIGQAASATTDELTKLPARFYVSVATAEPS
ncbi:pentapeptide repeat-containing protein [Streptomyces canus]|uniref:pentapeptide repeat-containing protein n=1 Tax=Streptomyces canus TaxID=58343 RepID=UPI0027D8B0FF|nr:pentapeptide repeat-containing protein [Streptomyces canus]